MRSLSERVVGVGGIGSEILFASGTSIATVTSFWRQSSWCPVTMSNCLEQKVMGRYVLPTFWQTIVKVGVWEGMQRVRTRAGQQGDCCWRVGML